MLCLLCSQRRNSSSCRANQTGPSATQHVICRSVDSPGPGGNARTTLRWSLSCRSALARVAGVAGVSIARLCVSLGVLCRPTDLLSPRTRVYRWRTEPCQEMSPRPRPPAAPCRAQLSFPWAFCEAMFDLNGVQEQLAVDRARPQVSRTRCTANRGNTASKGSAEAKQAQSSLSSAAYKCGSRCDATANRCSDFNYEATTQPTASSFTFHFRRTNGAGIVPLTVSSQP